MGLVPLLAIAALSLSGLGVAIFFWAVRSGQFDELDAEAMRALVDAPPLDDDP